MSKRHSLLVCLLCAAGSLLAGVDHVTAQPSAKPALKDKSLFSVNGKPILSDEFDAEVDSVMGDIGIPALSLAIIDNNQVVHYNAYGYKRWSKKDPVDKQTVFEAASLSKTFLTYAAFRLVEMGKLDLDKPMYEYLDPGPELSANPWYKLITPKMVLSHSSGLENWKRNNNPDSLEIIAKPGTRFIYSGTGYNLLADVIAHILQEPYEVYVKELVLDPLGLKNSYLQFKDAGAGETIPSDYAVGHDGFENEFNKWRNKAPFPASGNNITAEDYAKLIIAFFDRKHLSPQAMHLLLTPVINTGDEKSPSAYGPAFDMHFVGDDTIVIHGGDNTGFKGQIFYSLKKKCGFVFLSNSDRGRLITTWMADRLGAFDIRDMYKKSYPDQYPSKAVTLFRIYREQGADAMEKKIAEMKQHDELTESSLYALGWELIDHDRDLACKLFEENAVLFPLSPTTYGFLAEAYYKGGQYDKALRNYVMGKELGFDWWPMDPKIKECKEKIADAQRRKTLLAGIAASGTTRIRAIDYNSMEGAEFGPVDDSGRKQVIAFLPSGSKLSFQARVADSGSYRILLRVSSLKGGNQLQLFQGDRVLGTFDIAATHHWNSWVTIAARVDLKPGDQALKIYAAAPGGGFDVNWIDIQPLNHRPL